MADLLDDPDLLATFLDHAAALICGLLDGVAIVEDTPRGQALQELFHVLDRRYGSAESR